ncbi:MAG: Asp-tRNA(Asn)/Glu-tRNA(Gln) amidotransferase subunit GatC [Eubacterium sp.]|nr:Asp-tRNA(Asn)/Glu-tRNA(Gln) amidotransferase subunit GatC [Eubacterium sp.]
MDIKTIDHLCELSKLNYTDEEKQKVMEEMGAIIELMDTVKEIDLTYDDTKDNNSIEYSAVRKDEAKPSFPTDKLLSNTEPQDDCYVVPKMVE